LEFRLGEFRFDIFGTLGRLLRMGYTASCSLVIL
jgi:hypothetical protein